jgi:hypothetical protein
MPDMLPAMLAGSIRPAVPVLVVAALVGAPGLVGCTGSDPKPATISTPPTTPAPSTPTATSPTEQVEAAVRAYYAELTRAAQTNDTSVLKTLTTKGCPCYGVVRGIDQVARQGKSTPRAQWTVKAVRVHDLDGGSAGAAVTYQIAPYALLNHDGSVADRFPRQTGHVDLSLSKAGSRWIIGNSFDLKG